MVGSSRSFFNAPDTWIIQLKQAGWRWQSCCQCSVSKPMAMINGCISKKCFGTKQQEKLEAYEPKRTRRDADQMQRLRHNSYKLLDSMAQKTTSAIKASQQSIQWQHLHLPFFLCFWPLLCIAMSVTNAHLHIHRRRCHQQCELYSLALPKRICFGRRRTQTLDCVQFMTSLNIRMIYLMTRLLPVLGPAWINPRRASVRSSIMATFLSAPLSASRFW